MSLHVASRTGRDAVPLEEELDIPIQWQGRQLWLKNRFSSFFHQSGTIQETIQDFKPKNENFFSSAILESIGFLFCWDWEFAEQPMHSRTFGRIFDVFSWVQQIKTLSLSFSFFLRC